MTAHPRGLTLIINNKRFVDGPETKRPPTRHGSDKDVSEVKGLFSFLKFEVHTKENLTKKELTNELDSVANQEHGEYDCFVLWLMSHGKSGEVYCCDGVTLPIQTAHDLLSKCETLKGKPKLFFIQACRGEEEDDVENPAAVRPTSTTVNVPTHADFLYSYSTVNDYAAYRNPKKGSPYVNCIVKAFKEHFWEKHLTEILTIANENISEMTAKSAITKKEVKLTSEFSSTLRKEVWFSNS